VNGPEQQIHRGSITRGSSGTLKRSVVAGCIAAIISGFAYSPDNDRYRYNYLDCPGITERLKKAADREAARSIDDPCERSR
jgi:hypothetical protein